MKRSLKHLRFPARLLSLTLVLLLILPMALSAGAFMYPADPSNMSIQTYTLGGGNVNVYSSDSLTGRIGSIYPSDQITIRAASGSALQVAYPTARGTKTGWIPVSAVSRGDLNTGSSLAIRAGSSVPLYRHASGGETIGTVAENDTCYLVFGDTNRAQLIMPVANGWKLGWVSWGDMDSSVWRAVGGGQTVSDGEYKIYVSGTHALDGAGDGNNVHSWEALDVPQQTVTIRWCGGGLYSVQFKHNGYFLDAFGGSATDPTNVWCYPGNDSLAQRWFIAALGDGRYAFFSAASGLALDVAYGDTATNNVNIDTWRPRGQAFTLGDPHGGQSTSAATTSFQWPMHDVYCTWRTPGDNMSWGAYTSNTSGRCYHLGCDLYGSSGAVYACADGSVAGAGYNAANGNYLILQHTLGDGSTIYSFYAHLASRGVGIGQSVSAGSQIGVAGSTGSSARAVHLHFAIVNKLLPGGGYYGYATRFSGNSVTYGAVTFYNPKFVLENGCRPS